MWCCLRCCLLLRVAFGSLLRFRVSSNRWRVFSKAVALGRFTSTPPTAISKPCQRLLSRVSPRWSALNCFVWRRAPLLHFELGMLSPSPGHVSNLEHSVYVGRDHQGEMASKAESGTSPTFHVRRASPASPCKRRHHESIGSLIARCRHRGQKVGSRCWVSCWCCVSWVVGLEVEHASSVGGFGPRRSSRQLPLASPAPVQRSGSAHHMQARSRTLQTDEPYQCTTWWIRT